MILGLVLLVTTGLAIFGFSTYGLYSRSRYGQLDGQLRDTVPLVSRDLFEAGHFAFDVPRPVAVAVVVAATTAAPGVSRSGPTRSCGARKVC